MDDEKKKELFPYFAYVYSQQLDPDKYGQTTSIDEWSTLIQGNEEDIGKITQAAEELTDEDWDNLDKQYAEQKASDTQENAQFAAKGAKLKKLKTKKCSCGCDMIDTKEEGGKITSTCSCKCGGKMKTKKHENGGSIQKYGLGDAFNWIDQGIKNASKYKLGTLDKEHGYAPRMIRSTEQPIKSNVKAQPNTSTSSNWDTSPYNYLNKNRNTPVTTPGITTPAASNTSIQRSTHTNPIKPNTDISIVDYLNSTGNDYSYGGRKKLAEQMGIKGYTGSADQNTRLLQILKTPKRLETPVASLAVAPATSPVVPQRMPMANMPPMMTALNASTPGQHTIQQFPAYKKGGLVEKDQKGSKVDKKEVKFNGVIPTETNQLSKLNSRGANSSTTPTNPDGSNKTKAKERIKKGADGLKTKKLIPKGTSTKGGETWEPSNVGKGKESMNPKDWPKSKEELEFNKKRDAEKAKKVPKSEKGSALPDKKKVFPWSSQGKPNTKDRIAKAKLKTKK